MPFERLGLLYVHLFKGNPIFNRKRYDTITIISVFEILIGKRAALHR
ncbi:hypothetical protein SD78_1602 [Bacillus badius]|nr:hypothetical protein SD78_1602 [Bacillus badius]